MIIIGVCLVYDVVVGLFSLILYRYIRSKMATCDKIYLVKDKCDPFRSEICKICRIKNKIELLDRELYKVVTEMEHRGASGYSVNADAKGLQLVSSVVTRVELPELTVEEVHDA